MIEWALAVTVHDPGERMPARFDPWLGRVSALYSHRVAACSNATSNRTLAALKESGFEIQMSGSAGVGEARRLAVWGALAGPPTAWIQYADLDRLLHWESSFPAELRRVLAARWRSEYVALGRTARALRTHPKVQILAETLANEAFSTMVGLKRRVDVVSGSALFSRRAAEILSNLSTEPLTGTDLEWPGLILRETGIMPQFWKGEGLEFETADYYSAEIEGAGSQAAWTAVVYDRPEVWVTRTKLVLDSIAALARVLSLPRGSS